MSTPPMTAADALSHGVPLPDLVGQNVWHTESRRGWGRITRTSATQLTVDWEDGPDEGERGRHIEWTEDHDPAELLLRDRIDFEERDRLDADRDTASDLARDQGAP